GAIRNRRETREYSVDRLAEIRMICCIEYFHPELSVQLLRYSGLLQYGDIQVNQARAVDRISRYIAKCTEGLKAIAARIKPLIDATDDMIGAATRGVGMIWAVALYPAPVGLRNSDEDVYG